MFETQQGIHNEDVEQAVIGALLIAPERLNDIDLVPDDFYLGHLRVIFKCIVRLMQSNNPVDIITVSQQLDLQNELKYVGGLPYLSALVQNTPTSSNIKRYAEIVAEDSIRRQLAAAGAQFIDMANDKTGARSVAEHVEECINALASITKRAQVQEPASMKESVSDAIQAMIDAGKNKGRLLGLHTGINKLNAYTSGWQRGDLIVIGGRPSMGKSIIGLRSAEFAAQAGKKVLFFSLEMSKAQLSQRTIAGQARVPVELIRTGQTEQSHIDAIYETAPKIATWDLKIDDSGGLTIEQICIRAKRQHARYGLDLLIIDHLHLIKLHGKKNEVSEYGDITSSLKALAKQLNVPIVVLAQLSRKGAESDVPREPRLTDLRSSGSIEQDADIVVFIHRPHYYDRDKENPTYCKLILAKNRNGQAGVEIDCGFYGQYAEITDFYDTTWRPIANQQKPDYSYYRDKNGGL
jgi:replicative DNA helicase